jgi:hypothetical protein
MEILLWLLPTAVTTGLAIAYAGWVGRDRNEREPTAADQERFAAAIMKPLPHQAARTPCGPAESDRRAS